MPIYSRLDKISEKGGLKNIDDDELELFVENTLRDMITQGTEDRTIAGFEIDAYTSEKIKRSIEKLYGSTEKLRNSSEKLYKSSEKLYKLTIYLAILTMALVVLTFIIVVDIISKI